MASREEIENLKEQWVADPSWDLEDTEGFEEHRDELLEYSRSMNILWAHKDNVRLTAFAEQVGCPGNLKLAAYIRNLERKIEQLEEK